MRRFSPIVCALVALAFGPGISRAQSADDAVAKAVVVHVSPDSSSVSSSDAVQFTALVKNTSHVAVTWSASQGTISNNGVYHAPKVGNDTLVRITATSVADPSKSDAASLIVKAPQPVADSAAGYLVRIR